MDQGSCVAGALCGVVFAGMGAMILSRIWEARIKMGLKDRTFDNFPASAQANLTSSRVVNNSGQARVSAFLWGIAFVMLVLVAMGVTYLFFGEG